MRRRSTPEGDVLKAVLDILAAERILAFRMNSGSLVGASGRPIKFGVPGMADVLAFPRVMAAHQVQKLRDSAGTLVVELTGEQVIYMRCARPVWIECKSASGRQSADQRSFQQQVEAEGHQYLLVRRPEDLLEAVKHWRRQA